ncbi:MAG TPA: hypothetical protein VEH05_14225 [Streptosporangiaceae bacterium]|nr:hypothetical protein [Streptosporangiaceae bacterium]
MSTSQGATGRRPGESVAGYRAQGSAYEQGTGYAPEAGRAEAGADEGGRVGVSIGRGLAGFLLILNGLYGFLVGLAAIIKGGFFAYHNGYVYHWSISGWGWLQLALGIVIFAAGVCILLGMLWARIVGVILAGFSAVASFLFIPYYPVWSIIVIAVDIFIIWALMSSGRRQMA